MLPVGNCLKRYEFFWLFGSILKADKNRDTPYWPVIVIESDRGVVSSPPFHVVCEWGHCWGQEHRDNCISWKDTICMYMYEHFGMWLLIHALDTCFLFTSPQTDGSVQECGILIAFVVSYQRGSMRGVIRIGHHGNHRWRQIQIQIQVYNAEWPLTCGAASMYTNNYTWALLWQHTFACKQWNKNFATHQFISALLCLYFSLYLCHSLNGNTNFKIRFVLGMCNTRHLAIGARSI